MSDPRVYFAGKRTLLAWIRTGLTIMAFGFVVSRFGLFLSVLAVEGKGLAPSHLCSGLGIALVLLGAASVIFAAIEHRRFVSSLPSEDIPRTHSAAFPVLLAFILGALGLLLALDLVT